MRIWAKDADGGGEGGGDGEGAKRPVKEVGEWLSEWLGEWVGAYPQDVEADDGDVQQVQERQRPEGEQC
ncbi:Type I secretion system ATPase, putative [Babesia ovata]|uniref:Type I secretion system ATPase, putative n=1 Tax=Babesia ovata TaxID=189622 RepID=A0A2H6KAF3_9APIC|nr:Type I secretion system ATPase, putative [Babesia ovata]GBE59965.1 Type I secretion system ATPase, putative [Babesia ovata]